MIYQKYLHEHKVRISLPFDNERELPIVYWIGFEEETENIFSHLDSHAIYVYISVNDWEAELTPWPIKESSAFKGNAKDFSERLLCIVDELERKFQIVPCRRILAGYSLAGLFSLWMSKNISPFDSFVCASPSTWYPEFLDYYLSTPFLSKPRSIYLSLGDQEGQTKNNLFKSVAINTEKISSYLKSEKIHSVYVVNKGNHFSDPIGRTVQGIRWIFGF